MQGKLRTITQVSLALVLALALIITACHDGDDGDDAVVLPMHLAPLAGGSFGGGTGTEGNPYLIEDVDDLQAMSSNLSAHYALANDIDLSAFNWSAWGDGNGFVPIGDATNRFSGGFDGRGYNITGLYINRPTTNNVGLFGHVGDDTGATVIKNVGLFDTSVVGARGAGTLIGRVTGNANTLIENCFAVGGNVTGNGATGGLIGSFNSRRTTPGGEDNPILHYSFTDVAVYSSASGGGRDKFGGLVGCSQKGTIQNSYSRSSVTVTDGSRIGGLAGCIDYRGEILNSYSTGLVSVVDCTAVGGLVGNRVGPGFNVGVVTNSFWDIDTSGQATSAGGTGKTTAEMKTKATFTEAGWNFDDIWNIDSAVNDGYPYLVWQDFEPGVLTISGTFTAKDKDYDGTNDAEFDSNDLVLSGVSGGDDVSLVDVVIAFEDASPGNNKTVYITSAALAGDDAGKYILTLVGAPTATADITAQTYTITGTITVNAGLAGVSVAATGGHSQTVTTNAAGEYTLTGVVDGATNIVITPTLAGYTFSPTSRTIGGPVTANVTDQDFTAQAVSYTAPITVGWETHPVNKLAVLAPWIGLLAAIMAGAGLLVLRRRRA